VSLQWIHRVTYSDGHVVETDPRPGRPEQVCFAGISQLILRKRHGGVTVEHLVRGDESEEWHKP